MTRESAKTAGEQVLQKEHAVESSKREIELYELRFFDLLFYIVSITTFFVPFVAGNHLVLSLISFIAILISMIDANITDTSQLQLEFSLLNISQKITLIGLASR